MQQAYFVFGILVTLIYVAISFVTRKVTPPAAQGVDQEESSPSPPPFVSIMSVLAVFVATVAALFIVSYAGIYQLAPIVAARRTPAFTTNPEF